MTHHEHAQMAVTSMAIAEAQIARNPKSLDAKAGMARAERALTRMEQAAFELMARKGA